MTVDVALATQRMLRAAETVGALQRPHDVRRVAARLLSEMVDADSVLHTTVDLRGNDTCVTAGPDMVLDSSTTRSLAHSGARHPAVTSYLAPGDDRRPRRVSDVVSNLTWWSSAAYREGFARSGGRFQLSLVTSLDRTTGQGWVLLRDTRDFSEDDVVAARMLQPLLIVLQQLESTRFVAPSTCPLTERELGVLDLLAEGLPTTSMARRLGISECTTRKHLEHIYQKLDVHDRLSAVLTAQRRGLLAGPTGTPGPR